MKNKKLSRTTLRSCKVSEVSLRDFSKPQPNEPICNLCEKITGIDCTCLIHTCECSKLATKCQWPTCLCSKCLNFAKLCECKND